MLNKVKRGVTAAASMVRIMTARSVKKSGPVWLVSERGFDARDNAYWFFRYIAANHPEITIYYLITPDSPDIAKIRDITELHPSGKIVLYGTPLHYRLLRSADVLISTHDMGFSPDMVVFHHLAKHGIFKPHGKIVLLQHGVITLDIDWYHRDQCCPDIFVTTEEREHAFVRDNMGQGDHAKLIGLCRYDNLNSFDLKDQVLIMPTWRSFLASLTEEEFMKSDFFRTFNELLRRLDESENPNYSFVFYPHIEMQKFAHLFRGYERVSVATAEGWDVQNLLKESKLLITDFSSVYHDFAYMDKPVLFLPFDKDRYETEHYKASFVPQSDYGIVCRGVDEVVEITQTFMLDPSTLKNTVRPGIFPFHDGNCCQRTYDKIMEIIS